MDFNEIKQKAWDNRKMILLLLVIFILAFSIRGHLIRYDYIFEFDSYYHARTTMTLIETGGLPDMDPLAYYQNGGEPYSRFSLLWPISGGIYQLFNFWHPFDKDIWFMFVKFLPALYGAIISLSLYWLGKEIYNKKAGVAMAFIAAVTPAFVYRTMAGFFEEDALGFLWMVLGFIFFVRAVKSKQLGQTEIINSVLGGVMFGLMAWTWGMYLLIPVVLLGYFVVAVLFLGSDKDNKQKDIQNFTIKFIISFILFAIIAATANAPWINNASGFASQVIGSQISEIMVVMGIVGSIAIAAALGYLISGTSKDTKKIVSTLLVIVLYIGFFAMLLFMATQPDILADRTQITSLVGEESTGFGAFGTKYNSLIIFPLLAMLLIPIGSFLLKKKNAFSSLILFFWILIPWFMAFYKLKFTYIFGFSMALAAATVVYYTFALLKKYNVEKGTETKIVIGAIFFLLVLGVGAAAIFVPDYQPFNDQNPQWTDAIFWIKDNTPEDAKLFNWWDQGHILAFLTERGVSTDNRNASYSANKAMAEFITTEDANYGYDVAKNQVGADYIVLDQGMFYREYSFAFYNIDEVNYSHPEVAKYREGPVNIIGCGQSGENIDCGGNAFTLEQFDALNSTWTYMPTQFYNGDQPMYIYRDGASLVVLNHATNNSNLAKVWMHSEDTTDFYEEVYHNGSVKIFEIK
ncbi:MAG: hypothetical protein HN878_03945 [Candidatus Diapherotrites archaeon]|nr:hypothetical protein [Candidatus Diapherotrites archaeon]